MKYCKRVLSLLVILVLASCHHGVTFHPQFSDAEYEKMGNAVMGTYHGKYMVLIWAQEGGITTLEIPDASISVSGWDKRQMVFHEFPIRLLSKTLAEDSFISQYFASRPNQDLVANYTFDGTQRELDGTIWFYHKFISSISFTIDSQGEKHHVEFTPTNGSCYNSIKMEDCNDTMILRHNMTMNTRVDIVDMTDNGKSLAGAWPSFMRMQVIFCCEE